MASKPLTSEDIALREKKISMTLDDIIKMSKRNVAKPKNQRVLNKRGRNFSANQDKTQKMRQYMNSRSTLRQGVFAQKRSGFQGNNFPLASEAARKAAVTPFRGRAVNHNRAPNWRISRPGGPLRQQGNVSNGANAPKAPKTGEALPKSKPKTLDSLFANLKERRMRVFTPTTRAAGVRLGVGVRNQVVRQPWLRGRFGIY